MAANQPKRKRKKFFFISLSVFIIILTFLTFYTNSLIKKKGYDSLWHFITATATNYKKSFNAEYEKIYIYISDNDFRKLQNKRDKFLKQGIITNDTNRYVNAHILHNNTKIKCKLRLKGHMTDHLQDKKWSFRIKTKGKQSLFGMTRFTLQHPGTRAYAYEWVYHQWLKYENILHLRYFFLNVFVNDEDWGIYALEEHFSNELLRYNRKMPAPILRFNPDMYWHGRISEKNKTYIDEQFTSFQSSFIEAYNQEELLKSIEGQNILNKSVQLLELFRRRKITTSQAFDIEKMAKFHAIIDLIGGQHSLDWSDVKYYYNPTTGKLEPVGYESFSVNKITQISGANKYFINNSNYDNFHQMIFNDSAFFSNYIYYLNQFSKKQYLDKFFQSIHEQLQQQLAILYTEFPYKNFVNDLYYHNAQIIHKILNAPASVEAHLQNISGDTLFINVACIDALPYLSGPLLIDDSVYNPINAKIIPSKPLNKPTEFITLKYLVNPQTLNIIKSAKKKKIIFRNKLLGTHLYDTVWRETNILPFASFQEQTAENITTDISKLSFVLEDKTNYTFIIPAGNYTIKQHFTVPKTHILIIKPGANITFEKKSSLTLYSALLCNADEEHTIRFNFMDTITQLFITADNNYKSVFTHCVFSSAGNTNNTDASYININNTNIQVNSCVFSGMYNSAINILNSNASFNSTVFTVICNDAIRFNYSNAKISNSSFNKISHKSITSVGSNLFIDNSYFNATNSTALSLNENSFARINNVNFSYNNLAIKVTDGSTLYAGDISINNVQVGFLCEKKSNIYGNSYITIKNLHHKGVKNLIQNKNNTATITINNQIEK